MAEAGSKNNNNQRAVLVTCVTARRVATSARKIDVLYTRDDIYGERESIVSPSVFETMLAEEGRERRESDSEVLSRVP